MSLLTRLRSFALPRAWMSTISESSSTTRPSLPPNYKSKNPKRKATSLLNQLRTEEFNHLRAGREWEDIHAGDTVVVERLPYMTAPNPDVIKGLVLRKVNKGSDSFISILNVEFGTTVTRNVVLYNPLIKSVKVMQKAFIHDGEKRVRRSKIYYFAKKDPELFTIT